MWNDDEFYIGYTSPMPLRLARFITRSVVGLGCAVAVWGVTAVAGHVPLAGGTFEFGNSQTFTGTIAERPYPALAVDEDRQAMLLVAPGKHGAAALVSGLDGHYVELRGTRIQRGADRMIEVEPGTIVERDTTTSAEPASLAASAGGSITLSGEIVDSKCFLGVMVPGEGKTHKDCASLCLRGGIPPALHVEDRSGHSALVLLTGVNGESVVAAATQHAGEMVTITGTLDGANGWPVLHTDPASWH